MLVQIGELPHALRVESADVAQAAGEGLVYFSLDLKGVEDRLRIAGYVVGHEECLLIAHGGGDVSGGTEKAGDFVTQHRAGRAVGMRQAKEAAGESGYHNEKN